MPRTVSRFIGYRPLWLPAAYPRARSSPGAKLIGLAVFTGDAVLDGDQGTYHGTEALGRGLAQVWGAESAGTLHLTLNPVIDEASQPRKAVEKTVTDTKDESAQPLSFERDIRPLFRDKDRTSMLKAFDLWSFTDVVARQDAVLEQVRSGHMPCDGAWPPEKVSTFADWISQGSQP